MRLLAVTFATLIAALIVFATTKFWGQSQVYLEYNHPLLKVQEEPVIYHSYSLAHLEDALKNTRENLFINVTNTRDQKVIIIQDKPLASQNSASQNTAPQKIVSQTTLRTTEYRNKNYEEIKNEVLLLSEFKNELLQRKVIFNIAENAITGHEIFVDELKKLELIKTDSVIVMSPYEVMAKSVKELAPTLIYGTSQPEILRIKAMESIYLTEAATYRADVVVYPLKFYNRTFFTEELVQDIRRRHKNIIVGPISEAEKDEALKLKPLALILQNN